MIPNMRRNFSGTFLARGLGQDAWRLSRGEPGPAEILVGRARIRAADALPSPVGDVEVEWRDAAASMTLTSMSAQRRISIEARSIIVHEPLARLYDVLPLATFDSKARRFWRRIFCLVRIPGGRYLLGALARRARGAH